MIKPHSKTFQKFLDDHSGDCFTSDYFDPFERYGKIAWEECRNEIIKILEENKELESISHTGKKVYKIYGNVIDKIKEL